MRPPKNLPRPDLGNDGILWAVDPGHTTGLAQFYRGALVGIWKVNFDHVNNITKGLPPSFVAPVDCSLVVEIPAFQAVPTEDLITLTYAAGQLAGMCRGARERRKIPSTGWKGSLNKIVSWRRCRALLSPAELALIARSPGGVDNNVTDAIGLGLFALGRFRSK